MCLQNVFTFSLKSGFSKFSAFCTEVTHDAEKDDCAPDCADEFLDDESATSTVMDVETLDDFDLDDSLEVPEGALTDSEGENSDSEGEEVNPDGEKTAEQAKWTLDDQREDPSAEPLRCHCKFGHPGFRRLKAVARKGTIPKRLADCPNPTCAACPCGKAHKRPKHTKAKSKHAPRDCVSIDVLVSATPGLIAASLLGKDTSMLHRNSKHEQNVSSPNVFFLMPGGTVEMATWHMLVGVSL